VLYLVRHGETAANVDGLLLGRADPPLTALGARQAARLATVLPRPDRVVASPLRRARDTAAALGTAVEIDERWTELDYGDLDGVPAAAVQAELWDRWKRDPAHVPAGGESLLDVGRRVRLACEELAGDAIGGVVVVVTHVSPIKAAIAWSLGVSDAIAWRMYVEDATITRVAVDAAGPVLRSFNEYLLRPL
jgi:broad specificity phosphatase PhoE